MKWILMCCSCNTPLSLPARLHWVLFGRMGIFPARNPPCMYGYRVHSLRAPLFPLSLTPRQSYTTVPTSADRAFCGFWDRLGAFYAALRELFEPDPHLSLCG
jgi:hypothetical protein